MLEPLHTFCGAFLFLVMTGCFSQGLTCNTTCPDAADAFIAGRCYYTGEASLLTYREAIEICHGKKAHLPVITNAYEEKLLKETVLRKRKPSPKTPWWQLIWLGAVTLDHNKSWFWYPTGTVIGPYKNWCKGQPDNAGREYCLHLSKHGCWNDAPCTFRMFVVCQW